MVFSAAESRFNRAKPVFRVSPSLTHILKSIKSRMRTLYPRCQVALAIFFSALVGLTANAQTGSGISGRVLNADTGEYLQSAQVRLAGSSHATVTDNTGYFN
jgi:hypothetical protein